MMKTIRAALAGFARSPLKLTLTLLTVGIGVGVLIFAMSISTAFSRYLAAQLDQDGVVLMVSNATLSASTGQVEPVRPSQLDENALSILKTDIPGVAAVAPVDTRGFNELAAGSTVYRIRSVVESDDSYAALMGLTMTAGSFYTAEDVSSGGKKAVISQGLAEILFGSAQAAIGQNTPRPACPYMGWLILGSGVHLVDDDSAKPKRRAKRCGNHQEWCATVSAKVLRCGRWLVTVAAVQICRISDHLDFLRPNTRGDEAVRLL